MVSLLKFKVSPPCYVGEMDRNGSSLHKNLFQQSQEKFTGGQIFFNQISNGYRKWDHLKQILFLFYRENTETVIFRGVCEQSELHP